MKRNKKIIISTVSVAAAFAVLCTAGVTLALTMSDNPSGGSISTAGVELPVEAKNLKVYSAASSSEADSAFNDGKGGYYKYEQSQLSSGDTTNFIHGGKVKCGKKSVDIENILPGDKVEFDLEVSSKSTISYNYRAELYVDATEGATLLNQLDFTAGELGILRNDVTETPTVQNLKQAVFTDFTQWTTLGASQSVIDTVHVTISLPITATEGQGESVKFYYYAIGVQNTVSQEDVVRFDTAGGGQKGFTSVAEAVEYAKENGITEIPVVGSTVLEEGTVKVDNRLNFKGIANAEGKYPTLNGIRFVIENGAAVTFDHVNFTGVSYIDVSKATALTLKSCTADVAPIKLFDTATRSYLDDAAFIVSGNTLTALSLTLNNNNIYGSGAAVSLSTPIRGGSVISDNNFGKNDRVYGGTAAIVLNGADGTEPVISLNNNTFYADRALQLGGSAQGTLYRVISANNTAYGLKDNIFADGTACAALLDSGSKLGENAISNANIAYGKLAFSGVDVNLDSLNLISGGKLALSENIIPVEFYTQYTVGSTLTHNALALYNANGEHFAYLNASGAGCEVEEIEG